MGGVLKGSAFFTVVLFGAERMNGRFLLVNGYEVDRGA